MSAPRLIRASDISTRAVKVACGGDSVGAGAVAGGAYYAQVLTRSSQGYYDCGNFSVPGTRSDQILAVQVPQIIASGANFAFINFGINDIVQGVAEATLQANAILIWNTLIAGGVTPIDQSLPPTNTSANVPRYVAHNVWRKLYCRKYGIIHIDVWPLLATAAGAWTSGLNADAIHPNSVGAIAMADKNISVMGAQYVAPPLLAMTDTGSDAGTFINNGISFGGVAANLATSGWNAQGSGGTYAVTAADANEFGGWLRTTMAAGTNVGFNSMGSSLTSLGWALGDVLALGMKMRWVDSSQALALSTIINGITTTSVRGALLSGDKGGATGNSMTLYAERLITVGSGAAVPYITPLGTGTGYFEISRPIVVNLTKLGLA